MVFFFTNFPVFSDFFLIYLIVILIFFCQMFFCSFLHFHGTFLYDRAQFPITQKENTKKKRKMRPAHIFRFFQARGFVVGFLLPSSWSYYSHLFSISKIYDSNSPISFFKSIFRKKFMIYFLMTPQDTRIRPRPKTSILVLKKE